MSFRIYDEVVGEWDDTNLQEVNRTNHLKRRFKLNGNWWEETNNKKRYRIIDPNDPLGLIYITKENTSMRNHFEPTHSEETINIPEVKVIENYTLSQLTNLLNNPVTSEEYNTLMGLFSWNGRHHHHISNCASTYQEFAAILNTIAQEAQYRNDPSVLRGLYNHIDNCIGARLADMKNVYDGTRQGVVWDREQEISHKKQIDRLLKLRETLRMVEDGGFLIHQIGFDYGDYYVSIYSPNKYTPQNYSTRVSSRPTSTSRFQSVGVMRPTGTRGVMGPRRGGKRTRRANRKSKKTRKSRQ